MDRNYIYGVKLLVDDTEQVAEWLCDNLFFERETDGMEPVLKNGGFRLILAGAPQEMNKKQEADAMYLGINHVALETYDIKKAIKYCEEKGLRLELNEQGGARHSGKVYGTGMDYFNIISGFGFTIEVSQKLHCRRMPTKNIIHGLEHVGLQVGDLDKAVSFYEKLGFVKEFEPVVNESDGHRIRCCMVSAAGTTVEVYAFEDMKDIEVQKPAILDSLVIGNPGRLLGEVRILEGTAGEKVEIYGGCIGKNMIDKSFPSMVYS